jgi:hypothetical protein
MLTFLAIHAIVRMNEYSIAHRHRRHRLPGTVVRAHPQQEPPFDQPVWPDRKIRSFFLRLLLRTLAIPRSAAFRQRVAAPLADEVRDGYSEPDSHHVRVLRPYLGGLHLLVSQQPDWPGRTGLLDHHRQSAALQKRALHALVVESNHLGKIKGEKNQQCRAPSTLGARLFFIILFPL